jgi:hypothetical protein
MASNDTFGLRRNIDKQIDLTIDEYYGNARPGELIVDMNPQGYGANAQYTVYVGKADGTLQAIVSGAPGAGTVTSIATAGSGLGFALTGGPITSTGTVTLGVPTAAALRTSLTIGNVANLNLDGNVSNILHGDGTWSAAPASTSLTNGTTSIAIPVTNGNINLTSGGTQTVTVTPTGANITGYANVTGVISTTSTTAATSATSGALTVAGGAGIAGNAYIGGNLSVAGNLITPLTANASVPSTSTGTGTIIVTGTGGIGVGGNIHVGANANVAGNLHALGNAILGSNSNVFITGGTAGQALTATGVGGALQWTTVSTSSISNGTSSVTIPVASGNVITTVGGVATITATSTGANIAGYANVTGNALIGANANVGGNINALGNLVINSAGGPGNVYIPGGTAGQVLTATGTGNLAWGYSAIVPRLSWSATADGTSQTYTNPLLAGYTSPTQFTVYKDGIALEPTIDYTLSGTTLTVIAWHATGSVISTSAGVKQA